MTESVILLQDVSKSLKNLSWVKLPVGDKFGDKFLRA